jgi:hypothetical protein
MAAAERPVDDLLQGLRYRDYVVLGLHLAERSPMSPRWFFLLRRGPLYVRGANARLVERGLIEREDGELRATEDGRRTFLAGAVILELGGAG